jgi:hypothetical protein
MDGSLTKLDQGVPSPEQGAELSGGLLGDSLRRLGPSFEASWAFCCGLVASGRLTLLPSNALHVITVWMATDALLGYQLQLWAGLKQEIAAWKDTKESLWRIPYTEAGSPAERMGAWVGASIPRTREAHRRNVARPAIAISAATAMMLVLTTYAGPEPLALVAAGGAILALLALVTGKHAARFIRWGSALQIGLAWSMGSLVLGSRRIEAFALGPVFGLVLCASYSDATSKSGPLRAARGLAWSALVAVGLLMGQPAAAALVAICALASELSAAQSASASELRLSGRIAWLVATLTSALSATYWR